jgi:hypothetical protein
MQTAHPPRFEPAASAPGTPAADAQTRVEAEGHPAGSAALRTLARHLGRLAAIEALRASPADPLPDTQPQEDLIQ